MLKLLAPSGHLPRLVFSAPSQSFWSWSKPPPSNFSLVTPVPDTSPQPSTAEIIRLIPHHIPKPAYYKCGKPDQRQIPKHPVIWSPLEIIKIRESCVLARKILTEIGTIVEPGISTQKLDDYARELIIIHNAYPSPLNFKGFPKSISTSVNNIAAHGIPDIRALESGDIISVDVTVYLDGFHGDCSDTFLVGEVDEHAETLVNVTRECLEQGIQACRPGKSFTGIGHSVHRHARKHNCTVVPIFLGHGIGEFVHGPPDIYHCLNNYPGKMVEGMVFTVGPVVSEGDRRVRILEDGWTVVTVDNSRTAQMEHTVLVTSAGVEILTQ